MLINSESESLVLSSFIRFPQKVGGWCVEKGLSSEAFSSQENKLLYKFLLGVWSTGNPIDPHVIVFDLKKSAELSLVGGTERLQQLNFLSPSEAIVPQLIEQLLDLQTRRFLMSVTKEVYEDAQGQSDTSELLSKLRSAVDKKDGDPGITTPSPRELNHELIHRAESTEIIPTGFRGIDKVCGRLSKGDFLVVGGEAKAGKSTLASNIACHIAQTRFVVVFTIEMNRVEFWKRVVNAEGSIPASHWDPTEPEIPAHSTRALNAMTRLQDRKMTVIDQVQCIEQAFAMCRALKSKHGELGAVVIDYLQMFSAPQQTSTRAEAVSGISRACKRAASALQTLVIGVSQLNDDGKSLESRGIQRDANLMLNVLVDEHGARSVVSAFNRNGPMGMTLPIRPELQFNRFIDAD